MRRFQRPAVARHVLAMCLWAGACSADVDPSATGESGEQDTEPQQPDVPEPQGPDIPQTAHCDGVVEWDADDEASELELLALLNREREARWSSCNGNKGESVPPLTMNSKLRCAARLHALGRRELDPPADSVTAAALDDVDYTFTSAAALVYVRRPPHTATATWSHEPESCEKMRNPAFSEVGIGYNGPSLSNSYWTVFLAEPAPSQ